MHAAKDAVCLGPAFVGRPRTLRRVFHGFRRSSSTGKQEHICGAWPFELGSENFPKKMNWLALSVVSVGNDMPQVTRVFSYGSNSTAQLRAGVQALHLHTDPAIVYDWVGIFRRTGVEQSERSACGQSAWASLTHPPRHSSNVEARTSTTIVLPSA
jgi:hypothetical protein